MRVLLQRVSRASVTANGTVSGEIGPGYVLLLGVSPEDGEAEVDLLATKIANLRILDDADGVMNRSALDYLAENSASIAMLVVSQFTLYADVRKGRRPSWTDAAPPAIAQPLVEQFCRSLCDQGFRVAQGVFGAEMAVELVNDGPVTIWLDSDDLRKPRRG
jgi:D-tyrosyl-tRNA(Tyr) deacylase